jgi:hypothetical protein
LGNFDVPPKFLCHPTCDLKSSDNEIVPVDDNKTVPADDNEIVPAVDNEAVPAADDEGFSREGFSGVDEVTTAHFELERAELDAG